MAFGCDPNRAEWRRLFHPLRVVAIRETARAMERASFSPETISPSALLAFEKGTLRRLIAMAELGRLLFQILLPLAE
jgi:hypothetical protein